jgi:hypothetical protein
MALTKATYSLIAGAPVNILDYGADPTGVADSTTAIQNALDFCRANRAQAVAPVGNYRISSTINIVCDADFGVMTILCPGATVPVAVRIGTTTGTSSAEIIDLQVIAPKVINSSKTGLGWVGFENAVGIELANLYTSQITIGDVRNFGIGVRAGGYTQGCAYNNVHFGILFDNRVSLLLQRQALTGFSNQNTFYGGQFGKSGAEGSLISGAYGIFCDISTNNNTFINPSVETEGDLFQFYFRDSSFNTIINPRFEVNDGGRVAFDAVTVGGGGVDSNVFINGYSFAPPNFSYSGANLAGIVNNKFIGQKYGDYLEYGQRGVAVKNNAGDGSSTPHFTGYSADAQLMTKNSASATDYTYKIFADGLLAKRSTDSHPRVSIDWNAGKIKLGSGSAALAAGSLTGVPSLNFVAVDGAAAFTPTPDNTTSLGSSSLRWTTVFATTGTINTSDERQKTFLTIENAERAAALEIKANLRKFKFNSAIENKGDAARIHFGASAQQVGSIMESHGLDPHKYGFFCYDEWDEQTNENGDVIIEAGNSHGIRYEELLCFIIAAI